MKQWLNDSKNRPIIYGLAALVMVGAIVGILFQQGIIGGGGQAPYMPQTTGNPPMAGTPQPVGPTPPTTSSPSQSAAVPPPGTGAAPAGSKRTMPPAGVNRPAGMKPPTGVERPVTIAGTKPQNLPGKPAKTPPGKRPVVMAARKPSVPAHLPGTPPVPGALPGTVATTVAVAGAPNARPDPFAPYVDIKTFLKSLERFQPPRPRVDSYAPPLSITTYTPIPDQIVLVNPAGPTTSPAANIGRVSGVMLGQGAYAIVDNGGQSLVLQPGDQLPNGEGQLISIQSDSISVKVDGQIVKVPISSSGGN